MRTGLRVLKVEPGSVGLVMAEVTEDRAVEVVPYDPGWPDQFLVEAAALRGVLSEVVADIEQIGSTAVPGMWAKPIIDIMAGTHQQSQPSPGQIDALDSLGYRCRGQDRRRPGRFIFHKRHGSWSNLSIVTYGSRLWEDNINIRDYLAAHPEAAAAYSAIKRRAAAVNAKSPQGYQDGKRDIVDQLRRTARVWAVAM